MSSIDQIFDVTTKPLIFDGDTGGQIDHLDMKIKSIERLGVSAIILEDKKGLKQILYFKIHQIKDKKIEKFWKKNKYSKKARSNDFMVIARIESFILGKELKDALLRAKTYVDSGADGIMI